MQRARKHASPRTRKHSIAKGLFALAVVLLSFLQLGRVYVLSPQELAYCLSREAPDHGDIDAAHHHDEAGALPIDEHDGGNYFQHCKDTNEGFITTALQPVVLPASGSEIYISETWVHAAADRVTFQQRVLAPPFQPPRNSA